MGTAIDIADDVLRAAEERERCEQESTGEIISELARSAPTAPPAGPATGDP